MASAIDKIAKMLRTVTRRDDLRAVVLYHVTPSGKIGDQIQSIETFAFGADWAKDAAQNLYAAAEGDFSGQGVQTYVVRAYAKDSEKSISRAKFVISETDEEDSEEAMSEPPTKAGQVAQSMRHTEAMTQGALKFMSASMENLMRQNELLSRQLIAANERNAAMMADLEEVMTLRHERNIELTREEAKAKALSAVGQGVTALLPHIAGKLTGKPMLAAKVQFLRDTLKPEQLQAIGGILDPHQTAAVLELLQGGDSSDNGNGADHGLSSQ